MLNNFGCRGMNKHCGEIGIKNRITRTNSKSKGSCRELGQLRGLKIPPSKSKNDGIHFTVLLILKGPLFRENSTRDSNKYPLFQDNSA